MAVSAMHYPRFYSTSTSLLMLSGEVEGLGAVSADFGSRFYATTSQSDKFSVKTSIQTAPCYLLNGKQPRDGVTIQAK